MTERGVWRVVDVAALPWPHLLFRCEWRERAEAVTDGLDGVAMQQATRSMVLGLAPPQVAACEYHRPDWHLAAGTAVALVEQTGQLRDEDLSHAGRSMSEETRWAFYSLKTDPIVWGGGERLVNGQHRICAMKLAGVPRCPIMED